VGELKLNLAELVTAIRDELEQLDKKRNESGREALFRLSSLELELNFIVQESNSAKGGFDIKVVSLGADLGIRTEQIQKVVLKYEVATKNAVGLWAYVPPSQLPPDKGGPLIQ
jgi:hypothetical protein